MSYPVSAQDLSDDQLFDEIFRRISGGGMWVEVQVEDLGQDLGRYVVSLVGQRGPTSARAVVLGVLESIETKLVNLTGQVSGVEKERDVDN